MQVGTFVSANCLPVGLQVGEYRILDVIGEGGFGVVYRALDLALDREIALKEFMPSTLAGRRDSSFVHVRPQHKGAFDAGLRSFINEGRLLARFSHPALVHVYRFFEENGTAYMVMHYYKGRTLASDLQNKREIINQAWVSTILSPILDVLEVLHAADCYHRDISPDNIFLQQDGSPVLLDFGAARRIIGDLTQALTMVLKPGFAPIEQYVDDGAMPQGAWTDVYQLGALMYLMVTGCTPPTSVARMINDPLRVLTPDEAPGFSVEFLQAIHRALAVRPTDRPQSISELKNSLKMHESQLRIGAHLGDASGISDIASSIALDPSQLLLSSKESGLHQVEMQLPKSTEEIASKNLLSALNAPLSPRSIDSFRERNDIKSTDTFAAQTESVVHSAVFLRNSRYRRLAIFVAAGLVFIGLLGSIGLWLYKNSTERAVQYQAAQRDALSWEQARTNSSILGLQEYLQKFPDGSHRKEAQALLLELSQEALDAEQLSASAVVRPDTDTAQNSLSAEPLPVVVPPAQPASAPIQARPIAQEAMGKVAFRIVPWGYVSVNRGPPKASPPMTQMELPEGVHQVEISNPGVARPALQSVTVKRGETVVVSQKFE